MKLHETNSSCVYILVNSHIGIVKIGISINIRERVQDLQRASGVELIVYHYSHPISKARRLEMELHSEFKEHRTLGEWFKITPEEAKEKLDELLPSYENCPMYDMYYKGYSISNIAKEFDVSRAYISARLKRMGVTRHPSYSKIKPLKIESEKSKYNISGRFKRIKPCIYSNGHCFKVLMYKNKVMGENYFNTLDDAENFIIQSE